MLLSSITESYSARCVSSSLKRACIILRSKAPQRLSIAGPFSSLDLPLPHVKVYVLLLKCFHFCPLLRQLP